MFVEIEARSLGIEFQRPFLEAQLAVTSGSRKDYPSNGINFAAVCLVL
jgi:hypothetical protein